MFNELDASLQKELIEVFRIELDEKIQSIADHLLQLEKNPPASGRNALLEEIFRDAHSIKGASRGVGLDVVADLSHGLESLFSALKKQPEWPTSDAIDAALESLDFMRGAFQQFVQDIKPSAQQAKSISQRLKSATETIQHQTPPLPLEPPTSAPAQISQPPTARWRPPLPSAPPVEAIEEPLPPPVTSPESEVLHLTIDKMERLGAWTEEINVAILDVIDPLQKTRLIAEQAELLAQWLHTLSLAPTSAKEAVKEIQSVCASLRHELTTASRQLQQLTRSMQREVVEMRQVKIATLTRLIPRMVRDLARELGKQVDIEILGDHLVIDRTVLNLLRDPLNHLLRNALDHGLEAPEQRSTHNKPATGLIKLHFLQAGHRLQVIIQDDGVGMDAQRIGQSAIKKGIIDAESCQALNQDERLKLIFRPGFSTREILTTVSGRGIGLDVVQTNLRAIHGSVRVATQINQGTTFTLDLPLTMTTQRGLIIRVAEQVLAIPTTPIEHILLVRPQMRIRVDNRDALLLDGTPTPLGFLADILGVGQKTPWPATKAIPAVVISNGWRKVAFLVDDALEDREIVIKKLPPPLWSVPNVAGGAITGTGRVVVVLDPIALIESALTHPTHASFDRTPAPMTKKRILVVDDSITTRTLENNILTNSGYSVQLATNGLEAWEILQKQPFHLVISDVQMPIMDGFQLTERIKSSDTLKEIPVIIVSSLGSAKDQQRGVEVGADAYIIKGQFETKALLEVVEQLIV